MLRFSFDPIFGSWLFVELLIFCLIGVLLLFPPNSDRLTARRRRVLTILRGLLILLIALLALRPSVVFEESRLLPATLLMLFDQSESMNVADGPKSPNRFDILKRSVADARQSIANFQKEFELQTFGFDSVPAPVETIDGSITFPDKPLGTETAIGSSLLATLQQSGGKRILGLVLLSDGSQRTKTSDAPLPQDAAIRFRNVEIPIYSVAFGEPGNVASLKDVAVRDLVCNDRVFVDNELIVSGQLKISGYPGRKIPLQFSFETESGKMEEIERTEISVDSAEQTIPFRFRYAPRTPGEWKLSVAVPVQPDEIVAGNNELSSFVRVVDGGLNVLYFEGTRRFEQKFLRMALDSSADIKVDYWRPTPDSSLQAKATDSTTDVANEATAIAKATENRKSFLISKDVDFFKPGKYAAYILGDVDSSAFKKDELKALADLVAQGTGLIILGGDRSFGAGGYATTPLADLFPFALRPSDRIPLDLDLATFDATLPPNQRLCLESPFVVSPTETGKNHYLTQLSVDPKKNLDVWNSLPTIDRIFRTDSLKPGATVLISARPQGTNDATSRDDSTNGGVPLLITQMFGTGRVAVLTTDSTWKWKMNGFENEHKQFWRQLVLWSAKMDELLEGELVVQLDKTRFSKNETVGFRVVYQPKEGEDVDRLLGKATIVSPSGQEENVPLIWENGTLCGSFTKTENAGDYRIKASMNGKETGNVLQTAQTRFLVFEENLEFNRPEASPAVLENIATATGGRTVRPEELSNLFDELAQEKSSFVDTREIQKSFYDSWLVFLIFSSLICFEWILRKIWGLV